MVLIDATILLLMLRPGTPVPGDEKGVPPDKVGERLEFFVNQMENDGIRIGIPTPALSEALVRFGAQAQDVMAKLAKFVAFEICPFDGMAAIEVAQMAMADLGKKRPREQVYAKLKYDRQIIGIAKAKSVTAIYSDDGDVAALARRMAIRTISLREMPLPPPPVTAKPVVGQGDLFENRGPAIEESPPIPPAG
jgi:hypothetical protein